MTQTETPELLTIGEVAARNGVAPSALRYYEAEGLLAPALREAGGRRRYRSEAVDIVGVIQFLADVGFTIAEIRALFASRAEAPDAWRSLAERKLDELAIRLERMRSAKVVLEHALNCPKDDILTCPRFWAAVRGVGR